MMRFHLVEAAVFATGIANGVACANDSSAQTMERVTPDDTAAVSRLLGVARGSSPLVCEMTVRNADSQGGWFSRGTGGEPLVVDSASSALLEWVHKRHTDPALVPPLRSAMRDDDACVRRVAASLISNVRHASAVSAMVEALEDSRPGTREVAALAIGMSESAPGVDGLIRHLHDDSAPVRRAAAWSLGELEAKKAMTTLIDLLAKDPDARVRQAAAWAIGNMH
jgi:HEAT repeat protein